MNKKRHITRLIKSQMVLRGITFSMLARRIGVSRYWVSAIVNGRAKSERVRKEVANILGVPYEEIWGANSKEPE